ncbi:LuxR family transcriptional regulator [Sphingomonas sp. AX6]|nr:LuxR family transcriptional regulator [Sphingomonas sp. AX6]
MPMNEAILALTEKEKQTLRLIVRGHDAKSTARSLGLSVHTINERLRDARRKMAVSSSRQAARLLLEVEGENPGSPNPDSFGDTEIGADVTSAKGNEGSAPIGGAGWASRHPHMLIGVLLMTLILGLLALAALPQTGTAPPVVSPVSDTQPNSEVVDAARRFLTLVDQGQWDESYQATGIAFRELNTAEVWATVSEKVRVPLGAVISRTFVSQENLPAPPRGYEVVKFRTSFANKAEAVETITLDREGGGWRVVGITIG